MAEGIQYLHLLGIAHGGMKPVGPIILARDPVTKNRRASQTNILISDSTPPWALLADFGSACTLATPVEMPDEGEEQGTPSFMAPELLLPTKFGLEKGGPSKEADIYALGMTAYQVLTGKPPFRPMRKAAIIRAVISGERPAKPENAEEIGMTEFVWNLLKECWGEDRRRRPTIYGFLTRLRLITLPSPLSPIRSPPSHPQPLLSPLSPNRSPPSLPSPLQSPPSPPPGVVKRLLGRMLGDQ